MLAATDPVASGMRFDVVTVNGHTPRGLDDFVGDSDFTLRCADQDRAVAGCGHRDGDAVRFTEKDMFHGGKDVRVWAIDLDQPGQFTARTTR